MRVTTMHVECDLCVRMTGPFDLAIFTLPQILSSLKETGWYRARGSFQDLCPDCNEKRKEAA